MGKRDRKWSHPTRMQLSATNGWVNSPDSSNKFTTYMPIKTSSHLLQMYSFSLIILLKSSVVVNL